MNPATEQTLEDGGSGGIPLTVAFSVQFLLFLSMAVTTPVLDALVRQPFGLSNAETSDFLRANALATLLFSLPGGWLSDRLGMRRIPLVLALLLTGVLTVAIPHIASYNTLLIVRFFQGAGDTLAQVFLLGWISDILHPGLRRRAFAIVVAGLPVAYLVGPTMASALGATHLPLLFGIVGAAQLVALVLVITLTRENRGARPMAKPEEVSGETRPRPARLLAAIVFSGIDKFSFAGLALLPPLLAADHYRLDSIRGSSALLAAFWTAFLIAIAMLARAGMAPQKRSPLLPIAIGSALYGACYMALGSTNWAGALALMAACGGTSAFMYLPTMTLAAEAFPAHRATAMAVYNVAGTGAMIAGFVVLGRISDSDYIGAFQLAGGLELVAGLGLGALLLTRLARRR